MYNIDLHIRYRMARLLQLNRKLNKGCDDMIKLTSGQVTTYEFLKTGSYYPKQISEGTGICINTLDGHLKKLLKIKMIIRKKQHTKRFTYTAVEKEYIVSEKDSRKVDLTTVEPEYSEDDQLVKSMVLTKITSEQEFYLKNHKDRPRKILAKQLGLKRIQLNYILERLG